MNNKNLIDLAIEAKKNALSPTKYKVGVALKTKSGKIYTGCNLGSANGLFNICAERVAIFKMLSEGEKEIEKIIIVGGLNDELINTVPCGICRQLIFDLGKDIEIICAYMENGEIKQDKYFIKDLLPVEYVMKKRRKNGTI